MPLQSSHAPTPSSALEDVVAFDATSDSCKGQCDRLSGYERAIEETADARVFGGMHFRTACAPVQCGSTVARMFRTRARQPTRRGAATERRASSAHYAQVSQRCPRHWRCLPIRDLRSRDRYVAVADVRRASRTCCCRRRTPDVRPRQAVPLIQVGGASPATQSRSRGHAPGLLAAGFSAGDAMEYDGVCCRLAVLFFIVRRP